MAVRESGDDHFDDEIACVTSFFRTLLAIRVSSMGRLHDMIAWAERNLRAAQSSDEQQP
jgi:hypothetical protein